MTVFSPNVVHEVFSHSHIEWDHDGDSVVDGNEYNEHCYNATIIQENTFIKDIEEIKRRSSSRKKRAPLNYFSFGEEVTPIKKKKNSIKEREDLIFSKIFLSDAADHEFMKKKKKRKEFEYANLPDFIPETGRNPDEDFGGPKESISWSPTENPLDDEDVADYLEEAKEKFGVDEEQALALLWYHKYNVDYAILDLKNFELIDRTKWTEIDDAIFRLAFENCRLKDGQVTIYPIHKVLPHKRSEDIVLYYYSIKVKRKAALCQKLIREDALCLPNHIRKFIDQKEVQDETFYQYLNTCKPDKKKHWLRDRAAKTPRLR